MAKIHAVLFDLDGTLSKTLTDLAVSVNHALAAHGFPTHEVAAYRYFVGNGATIMIRRALPEDARDDATVAKLRDTFMAHYSVHSQDTTGPYDGVTELVAALRAKGYRTAVVTNKPDSAAQDIVASMFPGLFDVVIGQREGVPIKPDPAMPRLAMAALGVTPDECLFLGDSNVDIATGAGCGAYPVGVLWGFRDREELLQAGAKDLIAKPDELWAVLARLDGEAAQ
ncbi:MAG: HAD-IA family hydrolase [Clostridia bacterium]|nr:HAD-IA family hydrolase [Clostridia bacterium]